MGLDSWGRRLWAVLLIITGLSCQSLSPVPQISTEDGRVSESKPTVLSEMSLTPQEPREPDPIPTEVTIPWAPDWLQHYGPVADTAVLGDIKELWTGRGDKLTKLIGLQFLPSGASEKELFISQGLLADLFREDGLWVDAYPLYRGLYVLDPSPGLAFRLAEYHQFHEKDYVKSQFFYQRARAFFPSDPTDRDIMLFLRKYWAFEPLDSVNDSLGDPNISVIHRHRDDLWIGTWNGGLIRYSFSEQRAKSFFAARSSIQPLTVRSLAVDGDILYVGTYQGLFKYHLGRDEWKIIPFPDSIPLERMQSILFWRGNLLVATLGEGLWALKNDQWSRPPAFKDFRFITAIEHDEAGGLWVGTLEDGAFHSSDLLMRRSLYGGRIDNATFFLEDSAGSLWVGTYGKGLFRRGQEGWQHFTKANSDLEDDWVLSAVEGQEGVYFGTFGQGLLRFHQDAWSKNEQWDGIPSRDISALSHVSGKLVVGTLGEGVLLWEEDWYE